jgi:N-acetylmuramoyl-L-alanine amidase
MHGECKRSWKIGRRLFLAQALAGALSAVGILLPERAEALPITDIKCPKRRTLPERLSTRFIILHTTEAESRSAQRSIAQGGKASYIVDKDGKVYRVLGRNQVSVGCGRSMWAGMSNLDNHAINIEVVGYHHKAPAPQQLASLRVLLDMLKKAHFVRDKNVMPHSQVAYGRPNKWHRRSHRGRKRCGMLFATDSIRKKLGLLEKPGYDPDVEARRLISADSYLEQVLYGRMGRSEPGMVPVASPPPAAIGEDDEIEVRTVEKGQTVWSYAGDEYAQETTLYLFMDGQVKRGDELLRENFDFYNIQPGTRIAIGYVLGGNVTKERTAYSVVGKNWNRSDTLYLTDGKIIPGDEMSDATIPFGTVILFRR